MEYPHCQGLGSRISKDFREIQKKPEMMPVGITFGHHKMMEKTHDFQTLRMVFWFILLINIWIEEHFAGVMYHHCSSLWSIWPKIEFSRNRIMPNILRTICSCTKNFDDFKRMGQCDFRKAITCLQVVSRAKNALKSLFLWNDTTWHHFGSYF